MRVIEWEKPTHRLTRRGIERFFDAPLDTPTAFRFKTREFEVPAHGGAFSLKAIVSGEEIYRIGARRVRLTAGNALLLNAGEVYSSYIRSETLSVSVFVPESEASSVIGAARFGGDPLEPDGASRTGFEVPQIVVPFDGETRTAFHEFVHTLDDDEADALEATRALLSSAVRNVLGVAPRDALSHLRKRATRDELLQRLNRAKCRMDDTRGDCADLDELASTACLSKYYFLRLFRDVFGEPPSTYARRLRLLRASQAIAAGASPVTAARRAGYRDLRSFRRACRRTLGGEIPQSSQF